MLSHIPGGRQLLTWLAIITDANLLNASETYGDTTPNFFCHFIPKLVVIPLAKSWGQ